MKWQVVFVLFAVASCSQDRSTGSSVPQSQEESRSNDSTQAEYPDAVDRSKVGKYDALTKSGGGYFYDEVLEYRVWVHPGGDDYYEAFCTYEEARRFSARTARAEEPLVLILQREWIDEPSEGKFIHKQGERITEWQVQWLSGSKRESSSIAKFLSKGKK
jgi:hypothetical protein